MLLEVLVDPEDKGPLFYLAEEKILYNLRLQRKYLVRNGKIAVMLISDAIPVDDVEHVRLMKLVQRDELKPTGGG